MSYYLINRKQKKEYEDFQKFWDESFLPQMRKKLWDYCEEYDGDYVNNDYAEYIEEKTFYGMGYGTLSDSDWQTRIGIFSYTTDRFRFDHIYLEDTTIHDKKSLRSFCKKHPEYMLIDDNREEISLDEFEKLVKLA